MQDFKPRIHLSESDYAVLTQGGALCDENGNLGPEQFEEALRNQMKLYMQRQLSNALILGASSRTELVQLGTLKAVLREQGRLQDYEARRNEQQQETSNRVHDIYRDLGQLRGEVQALLEYVRGHTAEEDCKLHSPIEFSIQAFEVQSRAPEGGECLSVSEKDSARILSLSPRSYARNSASNSVAGKGTLLIVSDPFENLSPRTGLVHCSSVPCQDENGPTATPRTPHAASFENGRHGDADIFPSEFESQNMAKNMLTSEPTINPIFRVKDLEAEIPASTTDHDKQEIFPCQKIDLLEEVETKSLPIIGEKKENGLVLSLCSPAFREDPKVVGTVTIKSHTENEDLALIENSENNDLQLKRNDLEGLVAACLARDLPTDKTGKSGIFQNMVKHPPSSSSLVRSAAEIKWSRRNSLSMMMPIEPNAVIFCDGYQAVKLNENSSHTKSQNGHGGKLTTRQVDAEEIFDPGNTIRSELQVKGNNFLGYCMLISETHHLSRIFWSQHKHRFRTFKTE